MANFTPEEISEILAEFFDVVGKRQYVGARYVPIFGRKDEASITWDNSKPYEPLTIVLYQGNSYTSRQYVPIGAGIDDEAYWAITGNYNAQIEQYRRDVELLGESFDNFTENMTESFDALKDDFDEVIENNDITIDLRNTVVIRANQILTKINELSNYAAQGFTMIDALHFAVGYNSYDEEHEYPHIVIHSFPYGDVVYDYTFPSLGHVNQMCCKDNTLYVISGNGYYTLTLNDSYVVTNATYHNLLNTCNGIGFIGDTLVYETSYGDYFNVRDATTEQPLFTCTRPTQRGRVGQAMTFTDKYILDCYAQPNGVSIFSSSDGSFIQAGNFMYTDFVLQNPEVEQIAVFENKMYVIRNFYLNTKSYNYGVTAQKNYIDVYEISFEKSVAVSESKDVRLESNQTLYVDPTAKGRMNGTGDYPFSCVALAVESAKSLKTPCKINLYNRTIDELVLLDFMPHRVELRAGTVAGVIIESSNVYTYNMTYSGGARSVINGLYGETCDLYVLNSKILTNASSDCICCAKNCNIINESNNNKMSLILLGGNYIGSTKSATTINAYSYELLSHTPTDVINVGGFAAGSVVPNTFINGPIDLYATEITQDGTYSYNNSYTLTQNGLFELFLTDDSCVLYAYATVNSASGNTKYIYSGSGELIGQLTLKQTEFTVTYYTNTTTHIKRIRKW